LQVVTGRNRLYQLNEPTDVVIDNKTKSLMICDRGNRRVIWWSLKNGTRGEVLVDNISWRGLALYEQGCLDVSYIGKHEVRRFTRGDTKEIVVVGGNGQ
jgi:hypothetical protein